MSQALVHFQADEAFNGKQGSGESLFLTEIQTADGAHMRERFDRREKEKRMRLQMKLEAKRLRQNLKVRRGVPSQRARARSCVCCVSIVAGRVLPRPLLRAVLYFSARLYQLPRKSGFSSALPRYLPSPPCSCASKRLSTC